MLAGLPGTMSTDEPLASDAHLSGGALGVLHLDQFENGAWCCAESAHALVYHDDLDHVVRILRILWIE